MTVYERWLVTDVVRYFFHYIFQTRTVQNKSPYGPCAFGAGGVFHLQEIVRPVVVLIEKFYAFC